MFTDRRSILTGLALVAAAPAAMAQTMKTPSAQTSPVPMSDPTEVKTAAQFYAGVLGPAEFSLASSQIAIEKISSKAALQFAGFELGEAITVNMVLKDLGTKAPAMTPEGASTVEKMRSASKGAGFDRSYIGLQLSNHEYLRDLADGYLHNTAGSTDAADKQGRALASLMGAVFKEHVAICKQIYSEMKA